MQSPSSISFAKSSSNNQKWNGNIGFFLKTQITSPTFSEKSSWEVGYGAIELLSHIEILESYITPFVFKYLPPVPPDWNDVYVKQNVSPLGGPE